MGSDTLLQEWLRSTDTMAGGAYTINRYGEGALGNPICSYDRETVQALIAQSTEAERARAEKAEARVAELEAALRLCDRALDLRRQLESRPHGDHPTLDPMTVVMAENDAREARKGGEERDGK